MFKNKKMENNLTKYLSIILVVLIFVYLFLNTNYLDCIKIKVNHSKKWYKERYNKERKEISKLEPKAEAGDQYAQLRIGSLCLEKGHLNYDKAFKYLKMSAEQGNSDAQLLLGDMYHHGLATSKNDAEAFNWYSKSSEQGNTIARDNLIVLYLDGEGIEKDYQKAISLLQELTDKEDMFVEYMIFYLYEPILGVKQDYERAFKWFSNPPKYSYYQNYDLFRYSLAYMYENGLGTEQDFEKAKYWYDKIGDNEEINRFRKMQENPFEDIKQTLGIIYYNTDYFRNYKIYRGYGYRQALSYYIESAEHGNNDSVFRACNMYYKKDKKEALKWLTKLAEHENLMAINYLGNLYFNGNVDVGIKKDYKRAFKWFSKYAELGYKTSMFKVAFMYYYGKGVTKDYKKAFECFSKIIEQENNFEELEVDKVSLFKHVLFSEFMIAWMYEHGLGVKKDMQKAVKLYTQTSELDLRIAHYELALIYEHGKGVEKNKYMAQYFYDRVGNNEDIKYSKQFINYIKTGRFLPMIFE